MAQNKVDHFKIAPSLLNDIVQVLDQIPGHASRNILNRIENLTKTAECEAVLAKRVAPEQEET